MKKIRGYKDILDAYCELFKDHPEIEKVVNVKPFTDHNIEIHFKGGMVGQFQYFSETNWVLHLMPTGGEENGTV